MIRIEEQNLIKNMNLFFFELSKKKKNTHKRYKEMISLIFCILYVFHLLIKNTQ